MWSVCRFFRPIGTCVEFIHLIESEIDLVWPIGPCVEFCTLSVKTSSWCSRSVHASFSVFYCGFRRRFPIADRSVRRDPYGSRRRFGVIDRSMRRSYVSYWSQRPFSVTDRSMCQIPVPYYRYGRSVDTSNSCSLSVWPLIWYNRSVHASVFSNQLLHASFFFHTFSLFITRHSFSPFVLICLRR